MPFVCQVKQGDWHSVELAIRQIIRQLGPQAAVTFAEVILNDLGPGRMLATDANKKVVAAGLVNFILGGDGVIVADNADGTITISVDEEFISGSGIVEVEDAAERIASDHRVVYQKDVKKLYLRRS